MKPHEFFLTAFSGFLLILAFPFFDLGIIAWGALVPLFWVIRNKAPYQAALLGWVAGMVFFHGLLYWVYVVLTQYGNLPGVVSILILIALNAYLATYFGIFAYLLRWLPGQGHLPEAIVAPSLWVLLEYLRGLLFSGFPWEFMGYSQYRFLPLIQGAEFAGIYWVSFLIVLVNVSIYRGILEVCLNRWSTGVWHWILPVILLGVCFHYGKIRLGQIETEMETQPSHTVALIQGNIRQDIKWEPHFQRETVQIYSELSRKGKIFQPDLLVWPETSTPFFFQEPSTLQFRILDLVTEINTPLLLGAPAYEERGARIDYFNSAFLILPGIGISGRYDKIHLVPFGEYAPFSGVLDFTRQIIGAIGDFTPGEGIRLLRVPWGTFGVSICYEIIFSNLTRQFVNQGAEFLVNITNDAWFGQTSAPYQHLSMAVFRAVENRVSVARSANTGISAVIDPTGQIQVASGIFTREVLSGKIYVRKSKTFYAQWGDWFVIGCGGVLMTLFCRRERG
jgi:apolipoprotein N-acyltransferase